ncbi:adenylate/guanylate cyclase domain-containing protein [Jhaorihella thermophila]|uniref:Adenylate cyclase n=1 Tax=Jhaorihella thermophila TaxID=488547 RepID=A0A1H5UZ92_9RHOB|nr:adenylate/guanylate cyclase domain-containing protein [Jhaorihella thermophila]SEF79728.1 adenylate cyclase [Jhaorihella thermophila]
MTDTPITPRSGFRLADRFETKATVQNKYTEAALERHKREGMVLAVRARWIAMALIAVFLVVAYPEWSVLYYHFILALVALNGWFMLRVARVGRSRLELALILLDLVIMTVGMVAPNPFSTADMPVAMQYRFENFIYFFVLLSGATLAYSWRTVIMMGNLTAAIWALGLLAAWWFSTPFPGLSEAVAWALADYPFMAEMLDPNSFWIELRIQEMLVFILVAVTLGVSVRRFNTLLMTNAALERERANLSRYFSPNVVEELSNNDEPLKQVRRQDVAVLFADIVDFTRFASGRDPQEVIQTLRGFHARMEAEVFRHGGTLDKYLGDGLMATFGTPVAGDHDATNALACARAMVRAMDHWNRERRRRGEEEILAGIGVHYGPAVLGDIGGNRLEFAVIGSTVNIASRLEALTRNYKVRLVISDDLRAQVIRESGDRLDILEGLVRLPDQQIRGIEKRITIWTHA